MLLDGVVLYSAGSYQLINGLFCRWHDRSNKSLELAGTWKDFGPAAIHSFLWEVHMDRRTFMKSAAFSTLALQASILNATAVTSNSGKFGKKMYKRIAVEESWMPMELFDEFRTLSQSEEGRITEPGMASLWGKC